MKFKDYLGDAYSVDEIISFLERDCMPFLKEWKKNNKLFLYSGRKAGSQSFIKRSVRPYRIPSDTPKTIHDWVDDWFYKKFGIKARSNSVFVTKSFNVASDYGDPFLIFPLGKYTILSSSKVKDLFETLESLFHKFNGKNLWYFDDLDFDDQQKFKSIIIQKLESYNFTKGLQKHNNEQMINCKDYYLVSDKYRIIIANKTKVK